MFYDVSVGEGMGYSERKCRWI